MKPIFKLYLILLAVSVLNAFAYGQSGSGQMYHVKFRGMSWNSSISDLNYASNGKVIPIDLLSSSRSGFCDYVGTDPMLFFREITGTDGKMTAEVAASISLNKFYPRTLLMFFSNPKDARQYNVVALDDSDAAIPPGCFRFVNLTDTPIQVLCGASRGDLPARQSLTIRGIPADGGQIIGVQAKAMTAGGPQNVYSNRLAYGKTTRFLVFIFQIPQTGQFEVKRLQEDTAALPAPSPSRR